MIGWKFEVVNAEMQKVVVSTDLKVSFKEQFVEAVTLIKAALRPQLNPGSEKVSLEL